VKLRFCLATTVLLLSPFGHAEPPSALCELLRNPEKYNGKEVTVRATWKYGFEWSQFYCLDCLDKGKAWLEIPYDIDDSSSKALRAIPKGAGIVNVTVRGVFMSGGHFGHLNGYLYQIVAQRVSSVAIVLKGMKDSAKEKEAERRWACGGVDPK
jgi:hypothetical protein